jgi:hypothetical protein
MSRYHRENPDQPIQHDAFEGVRTTPAPLPWIPKWYVPFEPNPTRFTAIKRETARKGLQYGPQSTPQNFSWDSLCNDYVDDGRWIEVTESEALERIKQGNPTA